MVGISKFLISDHTASFVAYSEIAGTDKTTNILQRLSDRIKNFEICRIALRKKPDRPCIRAR
jgi:hypothetical protein